MSDVRTGSGQSAEIDAVIVGAGIAGLYMLYRLRELGLSARVYELGSGVGGTWYWNRYPGARCDSDSMDYSYSFSEELQREWRWTHRYATQPEILTYVNHVADRFDLRRDIQFNTRVDSAIFDDVTNRWTIETDRGDRVAAKYCIMATGCLSARQVPRFKGLESFQGDWYHTGDWPHEPVDFAGKRVGIVGTGSTGVQAIPIIAQRAAHLFVFQRTPNFSIPAGDAPLDPEYERALKARYAEHRRLARMSRGGFVFPISQKPALEATPEERQREYEICWARGGTSFTGAFADLYTSQAANDTAAEFVRAKIRETVHDPVVAEMLSPRDHPLGTKRLCADTNYYETYNRDNVTLVDVRRSPIEEITPRGLRTRNAEYELDVIVFATGYNAMTGALLNIDVRGSGGKSLREKWGEGPKTYLGVSIAGFPNLFTITGPGSPSVLSNMMVSIEQHVEWIADCIEHLEEQQVTRIEASAEAEDAWVRHVNEVGDGTLYPLANSWYVGANIPGKPRVFMPYVGGVGTYREKCNAVATHGYAGFILTAD